MLTGNNCIERETTIITRFLSQHDVDFAAPSETRLADKSQLTEVGAGYTFYWIGKPELQPRQTAVGFAVWTLQGFTRNYGTG